MVIRAHGVGPQVYEDLESRKVRLVDATCPFVKKIHELVQETRESGEQVIILGDPAHPEVKGIAGWCPREPLIYGSLGEILQNPPPKDQKYFVVEQTTFDQTIFSKILVFFEKMEYNLRVRRTICTSTMKHQQEAMKLASMCDAMLVIGGKHSSNTRKYISTAFS